MLKIKNKTVIKNVAMLYLMNIAKMVFPLFTLPYLTRVLSLDCYGAVQYVKSIMVYMQLFVDFGFALSGVKEIVNCKGEENKISYITSTIVLCKLTLSFFALLFLLVISTFIFLLKANFVFSLLSFTVIILSSFLVDFLFIGLEKMQIITVRFIIMKAISTFLTFIMVKNNADILWIPVLDIISSMAAIGMTLKSIKRLSLHFCVPRLSDCIASIKKSSVYFVSQVATTAFGAFNTILVGMYMTANDVAYWSMSLQLITAAQSVYNPISNGIYPHMVAKKEIKLIKNIIRTFMPLIIIASIGTFIFTSQILTIICGPKYLQAASCFRCMIPVLVFSFPVFIYGWPTLGSIGKVKEISLTTVITAAVQVACLLILLLLNKFTLINIALLRSFTELLMLLLRYRYYIIYKDEFVWEEKMICDKLA